LVFSEEERKAKKNAIQKKYRARPEIKAKYNEKNKERMKKYNKKPEVIATRKKYNASPERKAKMKKRYAKPETKATIQKYRASPQGKAKMKERYTSSKVKTKKRESNHTFSRNAKIIIGRGKRECACCGNKNFKWLQIDHIIPQRTRSRENTTKLRREIVQRKRLASEFQLLCANCNFAKKDLKACPIDHSLD